MRKRYPDAFSVRVNALFKWAIVVTGDTRIGVGDTPKEAWADAAEFVREFGG